MALATGPGTSGGGFSCALSENPKHPVLLDFVENKNLLLTHSLFNKHNPPLQLGVIGKTLGYETIKIKELQAFQTVEEKLNKWEPHHPILISILKKAIHSMVWRFTEAEVFKAENNYYINSEKCVKITPVVFFTEELGALTSVDEWNLLDNTSQAGLILHEAFRYIQFIYDNINPLQTVNIQSLTTLLIFSETQNTDLTVYLSSQLADFEKRSKEISIQSIQFQKDLCSLFSNEEDIKSSGFCVTTFDAKLLSSIAKSLNSTLTRNESADRSKLDLIDRSRTLLQNIVSLNVDIRTFDYKDVTNNLETNRLVFNVGEDKIFEYIVEKSSSYWASVEKKLDTDIENAIQKIRNILFKKKY